MNFQYDYDTPLLYFISKYKKSPPDKLICSDMDVQEL